MKLFLAHPRRHALLLFLVFLGMNLGCGRRAIVNDRAEYIYPNGSTASRAKSVNDLDSSEEILWRIGKVDDSNAEFATADEIAGGSLSREVPTDWLNRERWPDFPAMLNANEDAGGVADLTLTYELSSLPQHGVVFTFKLLDGTKVVPELAVYSNDILAGLIQLWGTQGIRNAAGVPLQFKWQKTYQLYIPKEFLTIGQNQLRLEMVRNSLSGSALDNQLRMYADYYQLSRLDEPASEPIHGKLTYMGTSMRLGMDSFSLKQSTLDTTPAALKWMGIAYSNNTMRAGFWSDLSPTEIQTHRLEYLELLKDYNMSVIASHLNAAQVQDCGVEGGQLCSRDQERLANFFNRYGNLFQWMEIDNEPGLFERTLESNVAIANGINELKPPHVITAAPGWAFANWARNVDNRRQIEALAETLNGHAYGESYNDYAGGSFVENLRTYQGVTDGWPKEYITTEMGTNKHHSESFSGSPQPHAATFDRITRAHIAVADRFMHHAFAFGHYGMFEKGESWSNYETLRAYPGVNGEETRLKTWRRYALAYATHGSPLSFVYSRPEEVENQLVYFRAVDTSTLAPLPGSGATSAKILLNFVNFSGDEQTMRVRVELPGCGPVNAERLGAGDVYASAQSVVTLRPDPYVELEEVLPPRESVQYIVDSPGACAEAS